MVAIHEKTSRLYLDYKPYQHKIMEEAGIRWSWIVYSDSTLVDHVDQIWLGANVHFVLFWFNFL
jgi:hypothetical protein